MSLLLYSHAVCNDFVLTMQLAGLTVEHGRLAHLWTGPVTRHATIEDLMNAAALVPTIPCVHENFSVQHWLRPEQGGRLVPDRMDGVAAAFLDHLHDNKLANVKSLDRRGTLFIEQPNGIISKMDLTTPGSVQQRLQEYGFMLTNGDIIDKVHARARQGYRGAASSEVDKRLHAMVGGL